MNSKVKGRTVSPEASPEILHHTVRRTWLFIAYSDTTNYHYVTDTVSLWKVGRMYSGVKWLISECCTPPVALPQFPLFLAHWSDLFSSADWGLQLQWTRVGLVWYWSWAFLSQVQRGTHWCGITIRCPSAPKTETTTDIMGGAVPWSSKAPGGTTTATAPTWTACTTTVTTRLSLTAWTGGPGKATTTPSNAPRWRSGLAISKQVQAVPIEWRISDAWTLASSCLFLVWNCLPVWLLCMTPLSSTETNVQGTCPARGWLNLSASCKRRIDRNYSFGLLCVHGQSPRFLSHQLCESAVRVLLS